MIDNNEMLNADGINQEVMQALSETASCGQWRGGADMDASTHYYMGLYPYT